MALFQYFFTSSCFAYRQWSFAQNKNCEESPFEFSHAADYVCNDDPENLICLECNHQSFVLETKQIFLPEYPHAFNPSIIEWGKGFLLSFRNIPDLKRKYNSDIGLVQLDRKFNPIGSPQILDLRKGSQLPCRAEDARLIYLEDRLLIIYSDNPNIKLTGGGFRMHIAELIFDGLSFHIENCERLETFEGMRSMTREKNWVPFINNGILLLAYSIYPHKIFQPLFEDGKCATISSSNRPISWKWGELRGGTQALQIDKEYLSFFHSSKNMATVESEGQNIAHYFIGAYTFSPEPPFDITLISPEPIIGEGFYTGKKYKPYWKPLRVVFPCGYVQDEKFIWLVYGKQDHEMWIAKLDKRGLLDSLVPVGRGKK